MTLPPQQPMYLIRDKKTGINRQIFKDDVRLAIGFLDTDRLMDVTAHKAFAALVKLTGDTIQTDRKFALPVKVVMRAMGLDHHNYDKIDMATTFLMQTVLKYNVSNKDRTPGWKKSQFLGPTELDKGVLYGEFPEPIWEKLKDPRVYAYITSSHVNRFTSKYESALYNWFLLLLHPNYSQVVCEITLESFMKNVLKLKPDEKQTYSTYAGLNEKLLSPYVKSLMKKTDFKVEYKGIRVGRRVQKLEFTVERVQRTENLEETRKFLSAAVSELLKAMVKMGLAIDKEIEQHMLSMIEAHGEQACINHLQGILRTFKKNENKIHNPGGFLRTQLLQSVVLMIEAPSSPSDSAASLINDYTKFVEKEAKSMMAKIRVDLFGEYLSKHYAEHQPQIQALIGANMALRKGAEGLDLTTAEALVKKPSLLTQLHLKKELLDYADDDAAVLNVLASQTDKILKNIRASIPDTEWKQLESRATEAKTGMDKVELAAIRAVISF